MQKLTASEAKKSFGRMMTDAQREPVFITKNNQFIGAFVSMEDLQATHLAEIIEEPSEEYQQWVKDTVTKTHSRVQKEGSKGISMEEAHKLVMDRISQLTTNG